MNNPTVTVPEPVLIHLQPYEDLRAAYNKLDLDCNARFEKMVAQIEQLENEAVEYRRELEIEKRTSEIAAQYSWGVIVMSDNWAEFQSNCYQQATDEYNAAHPVLK